MYQTSSPSSLPTPTPPTASGFVGPFVSKATSSEVVTIPSPPQPVIIAGASRTNCPEDEGGLLSWHDSATWMTSHGHVPLVDEDVTLPENNKVVVTQSIVEKLGVITIPPTSELVFAENGDGIAMDIHGMEVQGIFRAGSQSCRYETDLTITLRGSRPADAVTNRPAAVYKGISVNGGSIDLHGERYYPTWSRLAQAVSAGQDYLLLQDDVNWKPNQEIVLVTTAVHDSHLWHQNEVMTIASVQSNPTEGVGAVVWLTQAVQYDHIANNGYQAEVGLLSRNIKIQGSSVDSELTDPDPGCERNVVPFGNVAAPCQDTRLTGFGGHIIVHSGGKGYVEGVELYRMGQTNVLGRYDFLFPFVYFFSANFFCSDLVLSLVHPTPYTTASSDLVPSFAYLAPLLPPRWLLDTQCISMYSAMDAVTATSRIAVSIGPSTDALAFMVPTRLP